MVRFTAMVSDELYEFYVNPNAVVSLVPMGRTHTQLRVLFGQPYIVNEPLETVVHALEEAK